MAKKMYVIQADDGMFYCGMRYWDKQLRKARIYHSLAFAEDVVKTYEECNCKIVEVSLTIVPETMTNAEWIRAMSDEELADFITDKENGWCTEIGREMYYQHNLEWLQQPAEVE